MAPPEDQMHDDQDRLTLRWPESDQSPTASPEDRPAERTAPPPPRPDPPRPSPPIQPAEVLGGRDQDRAPGGRLVLEASDRLADRLIERLHHFRDDIDQDLAALRSEVADLRRAVDAVGERVQLRQLRGVIDELRGDVTGLRRAVLEWPELEQVSADIATIGASLPELMADVAAIGRMLGTDDRAGGTPDRAVVEAVHAGFIELKRAITSGGGSAGASDGPALEALAAELAGVRQELAQLKRRISLRVLDSE